MKKNKSKTRKGNIKRFNPKFSVGLTNEQVIQRIEEKLVNYDTSIPTKTIPQILKENFITIFNILNLILGILVFSVGSYKNMMFLLIVILNTAISTVQEIHSKKIVDRLSVLASSRVMAIRNGKKQQIGVNDIVLDDVLEFKAGNQIPIDCVLLEGEIEVNESFLTGEPNSIVKRVGDKVLSGSYLVSGVARAKVEHIGEENYAAQISSGAKYVKEVNSEIMTSLNKIIKVLTFIIVPVGIFLFFNQLHVGANSYKDAIVKTVAAVIGMIPEGLVLLTSTVLAVSVIRLSKNKVLVQELYCIEILARVDTLCLDKTGTLTEGKMEVKDVIVLKSSKKELENVLANLAKFSTDTNATIEAIREAFYNIDCCIESEKNKDKVNKKIKSTLLEQWNPEKLVPFSSETKWSGICFEEHGTYIIGAPEIVLKEKFEIYKEELENYANDYRVLLIAHSKSNFDGKDKNVLPEGLEPIGLVLISDKIRKEAAQTIKYFKEQGVDIKIISGDNPVTVSKIAKQVGVEKFQKYIDMSTIKSQEELEKVALEYTIFGRVSPIQKKELVIALQKNGKTVAMTGDGVNDVLAMKTSDCSIAMANGSDATKNVAELVLLDSNFASMPKVVAEGRRTINNIERSASLFLVKTIYSTINALLFLFIGEEYPFEPIQLSLISVVTIGIPSFVLALEPNKERIHGNFLKNVVSRALPTAFTVVVNIFAITMLNKWNLISQDSYSTLCIIATGLSAICLLVTMVKVKKGENTKLPFSIFRLILCICLIALFIFGLTFFGDWFNVCPLYGILPEILRIAVVTVFNFLFLNILFKIHIMS